MSSHDHSESVDDASIVIFMYMYGPNKSKILYIWSSSVRYTRKYVATFSLSLYPNTHAWS